MGVSWRATLVFTLLVVLSLPALFPQASTSTPPPQLSGTPPSGFVESTIVANAGNPIGMAFLPDGTPRFVVVEQGGNIHVWDGAGLNLVHTMTEVNLNGNERGLLGVVVDPGWPGRPYVYVHYTADTIPTYVQIARFNLTETGGVFTLDALSKLILLDNIPDAQWNHNGGTVRFGPDGMLFVSLGDDATSGGCTAQDLTILSGKILRLRVDDAIDPSDRATLAPPDNPWSSAPSLNQRLVWAYGLRNPFRFDIDPVTGDVFIGDVGQNAWEEVSLANQSGMNFGWPYREANAVYRATPCPTDISIPATVPPIYAYAHGLGAQSVIGTPVYRGVDFPNDGSFPPEYEGNFFLFEHYDGFLRALRLNAGGTAYNLVPGVSGTDWGTAFDNVADMVRGPDGALYYVTLWGGDAVRRLAFVPSPPAAPTAIDAALANGDQDVRITWVPSNPETGVDHYEVLAGTAYDPIGTGYVAISPDLPPGTTEWVHLSLGPPPLVADATYFYRVQAVGPNGERNASAGQAATFWRQRTGVSQLVSVPVLTATALMSDQFRGTFPWTWARRYDALDAADPWKKYDPARPFNEVTAAGTEQGMWLTATAAGDYRVAGRVPCTSTILLQPGWNLVGFPSMTSVSVATATAGLVGPLRIEGPDPGGDAYHLVLLGPSDLLEPTRGYWVRSATAQPWTLENSPEPDCV